MHTAEQAKKRRMLLLLVLFFSVIMLFDAIILLNRQEPQTYQSRASTITNEEPSAIEIANNYTSVGQFLEDLSTTELTEYDKSRIILSLHDELNFSFASAEANIENLFLNAQEIMTTEGKKKLIFRSDDIAKTDKAIINIAVPVRAYYETVTYFHEKKSTSQATAQKNEAVDNAKKLLKETDVDKIQTSQELAQKNKEIADAMLKIDEVDTNPTKYGPLQYSDKELGQLRLDLLIKRVQLIETALAVEAVSKNSVGAPETSLVEQLKELAKAQEIEELKNIIQKLNNEIDKLKDQKTQPQLANQSGQSIGSSTSAPPTDISVTPSMICDTTFRNQGYQYTCDKVQIGSKCQDVRNQDSSVSEKISEGVDAVGNLRYAPLTTAGSAIAKKALFNYVCVKNNKLSQTRSNITCDCVAQGKAGWTDKFPVSVVKNHPKIATVLGIIALEEWKFGIIRNAIKGGGDGGSGGNPTGRY